jgi:hypothetical protein
MNDELKTKEQLIKELNEFRQRINEVEKSDIDRGHTEEIFKNNATLISETMNFANLGSWEWDHNTNDMFWF